MARILNKAVELHSEWIRIAKLFNAPYPEDTVQNFYLKLNKVATEENCIRDGEIYKPFMYFIIKNMVLDEHRRKKWNVEFEEKYVEQEETKHIDELSELITKRLNKYVEEGVLSWYDVNVYRVWIEPEHYTKRGKRTSFRKLAEEIETSTPTLFFSVKRVKEVIKNDELIKKYYDEYRNQ